MNKLKFILSALFVATVIAFSCTSVDLSIIPEELESIDSQFNPLELTKAAIDDSCCYHQSTGLVLRNVVDKRLVQYGSEICSDNAISGYALKVRPRTYKEQKYIEQMKGIKVSYIPFGYEPVYVPAGTDVRSLSLKNFHDDTREILVGPSIGKAYDGYGKDVLKGPSIVKIPALYIEWPIEIGLPDDMDYEIMYAIKSDPTLPGLPAPSRYNLVFQTYDPVLSTNVRLKNLKIRISKSGTLISEELTDANGRATITASQASYDWEPLTYSITTIFSSAKWTITSDTTSTTPIHNTLGTLSQYYDILDPVDTIYFTLSSTTNEFEIHRAIDYYRNDQHELSSTILSSENSLIIATPNVSSQTRSGVEYWDDVVADGANIIIYNNGSTLPELMGTIFHEIGHARKDYAQGTSFYNSYEQQLIHESYASFIGFHLSRKYYIDKDISFTLAEYTFFNTQHRQFWLSGIYSPLFIDLADNVNQSTFSTYYNYVIDTISGVPIYDIDRLGIFIKSLSEFITNSAYMVNLYFTQAQLDVLLLNYL